MLRTSNLRRLWEGTSSYDMATVRAEVHDGLVYRRYLQPCVAYDHFRSFLLLGPGALNQIQRQEMQAFIKQLYSSGSPDSVRKSQELREAWKERPPVRRFYVLSKRQGVGTAFHVAPQIAIANDHGMNAPGSSLSLSVLGSNIVHLQLEDSQQQAFPKGEIRPIIVPTGTNYDCCPRLLTPPQELRFLATSDSSHRILIPSARFLKKETNAMVSAGFCYHNNAGEFEETYASIKAKNNNFPSYDDYIAAFPPNTLTLSPCQINSISPWWLRTDGSMTGGHCGSPLLYTDDPQCFAGIYSGGNIDDGTNFFWAVTDPVFIANWCMHALPQIITCCEPEAKGKAQEFVNEQRENISKVMHLLPANVLDIVSALIQPKLVC
eukprot:TRINITY_DN823_c0_g1_i1.p1 TRINITY_DN823_c0_g1~~TRINITY_DN823_c0_g1_i1.p1  ORF type:complete len:378 (-),score=35.90 TRINITY_DN823_c0_g1_i1:108-1241(-)